MMKPPLPYKRIVRMRTKRMTFSLRNMWSLHLKSNLLLQVVIRVAIWLSALWMARLFFHQSTRKRLDFSFCVLLFLSKHFLIFFVCVDTSLFQALSCFPMGMASVFLL
jgi:hypothetical protein